MRLSFAWACAFSMTVSIGVVALSGAATSACSSDDNGGGSSGKPFVPEGGMITGDGAVVDMDGNVVEQDTSTPKPSKVVATVENVDVLGKTRQFALAVPKSYSAGRKYPLILALHGDGQDGPGFRAFLPFDDIAGDDAIVAYQSGTEDLYTPYDQNSDQLLVEATIAFVKGKFSVDDNKVWGFGYSKGGFLANEIACRKPGMLKAMAVHASGAPEEMRGGDGYPICPGVIGLPVLATNGEFDTGIGGEYAANYWAKNGGCSTSRTPTTPMGCQKYDGCPAGKNVTYCVNAGVGHFPIWNEAAAASWAFFKAL